MSYSRWSTSRWYTFYVANDSHERDKQYFDVCMVRCFSFKELMKDLDGCLDEVVRKENKGARIKITDKEKYELRSYMLEFIEDVRMDKSINEYMMVKKASNRELPLLVNLKGPAGELLQQRLKKL